MTPQEVAQVALHQQPSNAWIDRITAVPDEGWVTTVEPGAGSPGAGVHASGPVWIVRMHGAFSTRAGDGTFPTGYVVIRDRERDVVAMGVP